MNLFGAVKFTRREEAREAVEPLILENRAIFKHYGPHIADAINPESGAAEKWKRKMLTRILPNSRRMLAILGSNRHLLNHDEKSCLEEFRQHIDDLEAFHIEDSREDATRFPEGFAEILED